MGQCYLKRGWKKCVSSSHFLTVRSLYSEQIFWLCALFIEDTVNNVNTALLIRNIEGTVDNVKHITWMSACNNCWLWQNLNREHLQQHAVIVGNYYVNAHSPSSKHWTSRRTWMSALQLSFALAITYHLTPAAAMWMCELFLNVEYASHVQADSCNILNCAHSLFWTLSGTVTNVNERMQ